MSRPLLALALLLASRQAPAQERGPSAETLQLPDLSRLEAPVRQRIEGLAAALPGLESAATQAAGYGSLGELLFLYRLYEPARQAYRRAHLLAPAAARWPYLLAVLEEEAGQVEGAAGWLEVARDLDPDDAPTRLRLARLRLELGEIERARRLYREVLARSPSAAAAWAGLGRLHDLAGESEAARQALERALELQPAASALHYPLARVCRRLGDEEAARRHLEQLGPVDERFPDPRVDELAELNEESLYDLIVELAGARDPDGDPQLDDVRFLSFALSQVAQRPDALDRLRRSLHALEAADGPVPAQARLHYVLGGLLAFLGRDAQAEPELRRALELWPDLLDARVKLANLEARAGRYEAAVAGLSRVLELDGENDEARLKRAAARMSLGEWSAARGDLESLRRRRPHSPEVLQRLALSLLRLGEAERAAELFAAAARVDPQPARAARSHLEAGRLLVGAERWAEAQTELERAADLDPARTDARLALGSALLLNGRHREAADHFARALAVDAGLAPARLGEATALLLLDQYLEARERLEAAHARLPEQPAIRLVLARVLAASPDPRARDGKRALELAPPVDREGASPIETMQTADTLALAQAETGDFAGAVRSLETAIAAARAARLPTTELEQRLAAYRREEPWRAERGEDLLPVAAGAGPR